MFGRLDSEAAGLERERGSAKEKKAGHWVLTRRPEANDKGSAGEECERSDRKSEMGAYIRRRDVFGRWEKNVGLGLKTRGN